MRSAAVLALALLASCSPTEAGGSPGEGTLLVLELREPGSPGDAARAADVTEVLRRRVEGAELSASVHVREDGRFVVGFDAALDGEVVAALERGLPMLGELRFSIVAAEGEEPTFEAPKRVAYEGEEAVSVGLLLPRTPGEEFGTRDLEQAWPARSASGQPAIGFELKSSRRDDFTAFTGAHVGRQLAPVLDGEVLSTPVILDPLPGRGILIGPFDDLEARATAIALSGGALPVALLHVETR